MCCLHTNVHGVTCQKMAVLMFLAKRAAWRTVLYRCRRTKTYRRIGVQKSMVLHKIMYVNNRRISEYGALVEWYWQRKCNALGIESFPGPFWPWNCVRMIWCFTKRIDKCNFVCRPVLSIDRSSSFQQWPSVYHLLTRWHHLQGKKMESKIS